MRLILVARPAFAAKANTASAQVDTAGGTKTFTVPLRTKNDATNTIRGYWCSWELTNAQATALRARLKEQGLLDAEVAIVPAAQRGSFTPDPTARVYIFAAGENGWQPQEVLDALNVDTINPPPGQ